MSDRDDRVFDLLRNELAAFDLGLSSQEALVRRVSELIGELADLDLGAVEKLRAVWWEVEYTLALSLDQERPLTAEENEMIKGAVLELETMIQPP